MGKEKFLIISKTLVVAGIMAFSVGAGAAEFSPTRTDDPPPDGCAPNDCSLREAVLASNTTPGPNVITLQEMAVYTLTLNDAEDDGISGDLDIFDQSLTLNGNLATIDATAIDDRVFQVFPGVSAIFNGVVITGGSPLTLLGGGGILFMGGSPADILAINFSTLTMNGGATGGGLLMAGGTGFINSSTIAGNLGVGGGGGIYNNQADLNINNSTISSNITDPGGVGAGIVSDPAGGAITLRSTTVTNNTAEMGAGGGIFIAGLSTLNIQNSILQGNFAASGPDCQIPGLPVPATTSMGYNIFGDIGSCVITPMTDDQFMVLDAGLKPLDFYGGLTFTHLLTEDSIAIDNGDPNGCEDATGALLTEDQRGQNREAGGRCDSGSTQLGTSQLMLTKGASPETILPGGTLTYEMKILNDGPDKNFAIGFSDDLPEGAENISFETQNALCELNGLQLLCLVLELDPGAEEVIKITATLNTEGIVTNIAGALGTEIDPNPLNNTDFVQTFVGESEGGNEPVGGNGCALNKNTTRSRQVWMGSLLALLMLAIPYRLKRSLRVKPWKSL